jgi:hypothetical protein
MPFPVGEMMNLSHTSTMGTKGTIFKTDHGKIINTGLLVREGF